MQTDSSVLPLYAQQKDITPSTPAHDGNYFNFEFKIPNDKSKRALSVSTASNDKNTGIHLTRRGSNVREQNPRFKPSTKTMGSNRQ